MLATGRKTEMKQVINDIYQILLEKSGYLNWWPADSSFEVAVGAVLTQNTSWKGVQKAIVNLAQADLLDAEKLLEADPAKVGMLIRPSGYFNLKTGRLKSLCRFLIRHDAPDPARLDRFDTLELRNKLLDVKGIGKETADSIILYAVKKPIFVIDAYTRRIFSRMGLMDTKMEYDEMRAIFEVSLTPDVRLFGDYHARIVNCGKEYCQKKPKCLKCPLHPMCRYPDGESVEQTTR